MLPDPIQRRIDDRLTRFNDWREDRPFLGGALLLAAGLVLFYVPMNYAPQLALVGGGHVVLGLVWAGAVTLTGLFVLHRPDFSTIFGSLGILFSLLSLMGALGGFFVGMLLGIVGGSLCIAWKDPNPDVTTASTTTPPPEETKFSWQEDD